MRSYRREIEEQTYHIREYEDWRDLVGRAELVLRGNDNGAYNGIGCSSLENPVNAWTDHMSLADAVRCAYRGWPDGRERIRKLKDDLSIRELAGHANRLSSRVAFAGDEVDIGRFLQGDPEHMVNWETEVTHTSGKTLRLLVNRSQFCTVSGDQITRKGLAVFTAVDLLESFGYSVEITIAFGTTGYGQYYDQHFEEYIPIKLAGEPLNLDTMAFMLVSPAVLRRLMFAAQETESSDIRYGFGYCEGSGYGRPVDVVQIDGYDLVLSSKDGLLNSDDQIVPYTYALLERSGIDLGEFKETAA